MKCPSCQGEWTPPKNIVLNKCPFCQIDLLQALNAQSGELEPEVILRNLLQIHGIELLNDAQRLSAMIAELFAHDKRAKNLLLRSVDENIPLQIAALADSDQQGLRLKALLQHLQEDAFLHEEAAGQIISYWLTALNLDEPDDSFEIIWEKGFCGFRSFKGTMITECKYVDSESFSDGLAKVKANEKFGLIDKRGIEIIPCDYSEIQFERINENIYTIYLKEEGKESWNWSAKSGYLCKENEDFRFFRKSSFIEVAEDMAVIYDEEFYGYINLLTGELIPCIYSTVYSFRDGLALVGYNYYEHESDDELRAYTDQMNYWGFIDKSGKEIIKCEYVEAYEFSDGIALVSIFKESSHEKLFGFIDRNGQEIIPFKYDNACSFIDGLALVSLNNKWGSVDIKGNEIIPLKYDEIEQFKQGRAKVKLDGKIGYIDKYDNWITEI